MFTGIGRIVNDTLDALHRVHRRQDNRNRQYSAWLLPMLGFLLIWAFIGRSMGGQGLGGMMAVGKSKARIYAEKDTKTTFRCRRRG
jgi:ATP-dependent Zn protease